MRRSAAAAIALVFAGLTAAGPAQAADPPSPGGCQKFGRDNVAVLAEGGRDFGALASFVASSDTLPSFQDAVVHPEQDANCPG